MLVNALLPSIALLASSALAQPHKRIVIVPGMSTNETDAVNANVTTSLTTSWDQTNSTDPLVVILHGAHNGTNATTSILPPISNSSLPFPLTNLNATMIDGWNVTISNGTIFANGTVFTPTGTWNLTSLVDSYENSTSILESVLPSSTVFVTAPLVSSTPIVTSSSPPSVSVSVSVSKDLETKTLHKTATETAYVTKYKTEEEVSTKTLYKTVQASPTTHAPSLQEVVSVLDVAAAAAAALPTVYLTLVPNLESDGHWDYIILSGTDGTATASPTFVAASTSAVSKTSSTQVAAVVSVTASPVSVVVPTTSSSVHATTTASILGSGDDTVPPVLTGESASAVISSLLPSTTPDFSFTLPGQTGTVAIGSTPTSSSSSSSVAGETIVSQIGHGAQAAPTTTETAEATHANTAVVSSAVASATSNGDTVGVVLSPGGSDEDGEVTSSANSTTIAAANATVSVSANATATSSIVGVVSSPNGSNETLTGNSTLVLSATSPLPASATSSSSSSIIGVIASPSGSNETISFNSTLLPSSANTLIYSSSSGSIISNSNSQILTSSAAASIIPTTYTAASPTITPSPTPTAVSESSATVPELIQTIQMGSASLVVVIPSPTLSTVGGTFVSATASASATAGPSGMIKMRRAI